GNLSIAFERTWVVPAQARRAIAGAGGAASFRHAACPGLGVRAEPAVAGAEIAEIALLRIAGRAVRQRIRLALAAIADAMGLGATIAAGSRVSRWCAVPALVDGLADATPETTGPGGNGGARIVGDIRGAGQPFPDGGVGAGYARAAS